MSDDLDQEKLAHDAAMAELKAGFEGKKEETNEPSSTDTPADPPAADTPAETPEYVQLTKQQFDDWQNRLGEIDHLKTAQAKASGSIGSLNQVIEQLKSSTKAGAPVDLTDDVVDEIKGNFGDELGNAVLAALKKASPSMRGTGTNFDPEQIRAQAKAEAESTYASKRVAELQQELSEEHPDWATVRDTPAFKAWQAKLSEAERTRLNTTNSVNYLSRKLTEFKTSQKPAPKPASNRQEIMLAAVQPRGDGGSLPSKTDKDDFHSGFYKKK